MTTSVLRQTQLAMQRFWLGLEFPDEGHFKSGADLRGLELYRRLMRYGWHDVMLSIYPICASILADRWELVVDDYIKRYPPSHYNLNRLAERFSSYLKEKEIESNATLPFIAQLADYEWLELETGEHPAVVSRSEINTPLTFEQFDTCGPLLNPTLALRRYAFPILQIADAVETSGMYESVLNAEPDTIIAFRPPGGKGCRLQKVGELEASLLDAAKSGNVSFKELALVAVKFSPDPQESMLAFIDLVEAFANDGVFVGIK